MCDWMKIHFINTAQHSPTSSVWFGEPPHLSLSLSMQQKKANADK